MDTKLNDEEIEEILNKIFKHQASKEENTDDEDEDNDEKEDISIEDFKANFDDDDEDNDEKEDISIEDFKANFDDDEQRKIYSYLKSKFSDEDDMLDDMYKKVSDAVENKSKDSTNERIEALEACVALLLALQAIK